MVSYLKASKGYRMLNPQEGFNNLTKMGVEENKNNDRTLKCVDSE